MLYLSFHVHVFREGIVVLFVVFFVECVRGLEYIMACVILFNTLLSLSMNHLTEYWFAGMHTREVDMQLVTQLSHDNRF